MKRLFKWLFILVVLVVAIVVGLLVSRDAIAKTAIEQQIRAHTGMDVKIGKLKTSILSPIATIEDLTLYNTADFGGTPFLKISELHIEFDREALAYRELKLKLLRLTVAELSVVKNDLGQTNIVNLVAAAKSGKVNMVEFKGIDVANVSISKVLYLDLKNQKNNRQFKPNLQNQVFRNMKTSGEFYDIFIKLWSRTSGDTI